MNKRFSFLLLLVLLVFLFSSCNGQPTTSSKLNEEQTEKPFEGPFQVGDVTIEMVKVDKIDEITLGDKSFSENKPHKVSLDAYLIGKYEVTQELFDAVWEETHHWHFTSEGPKAPVDHVSWFEAIAFCNMLTLKIDDLKGEVVYYSDAKMTKVYTKNNAKNRSKVYANWTKKGFRLPTEAEWEVAARAGDPKAVYSGATADTEDELKEVAWFFSNSDAKTHQVGKKRANAFGLFDMTGNVSEWCWDWCNSITENLGTVLKNPHGEDEQDDAIGRTLRGGNYDYRKDRFCFLFISFRDQCPPEIGMLGSHKKFFGFRLAKTL